MILSRFVLYLIVLGEIIGLAIRYIFLSPSGVSSSSYNLFIARFGRASAFFAALFACL